MRLEILAAGLRHGDVWLGDGTRLHVVLVHHDFGKFVPWGGAANHPPEPMDAVIVNGVLEWDDGRRRSHSGVWTLQPDMPIEVERP